MSINGSVRTSNIIEEVTHKIEHNDSMTIGEFIAMLGDRSFGLAMLLFAIPNAFPVPGIPGFSAITGAPIIFIALQMALGAKKLWIPKFVSRRKLSGKILTIILKKSIPVLRMLEKILKPRLKILTSKPAEISIGIVLIVVAWVLAMPVPLGNFLPGLAITIISLALIERDGLFIIAGLILSVFAVTVVGGMVYAAILSVIYLIRN